MKLFKTAAALLLVICLLGSLAACQTAKPGTATGDSAAATADEANAAETSKNINGMRFNLTLREFTERFNAVKKQTGDTDFLTVNNWEITGAVKTDSNGVKIDYWHYDEPDISYTASMETATMKIMNIGCGTTKGNFDKADVRDTLIAKAAFMAQIACGFSADSQKTLQKIYAQAVEYKGSLWYKGYVFDFSTDEENGGEDNSIVLFRVFPITDELKKEWNLTEYQENP